VLLKRIETLRELMRMHRFNRNSSFIMCIL
jgi:hypothetical protein